jgi:hypothetical protein
MRTSVPPSAQIALMLLPDLVRRYCSAVTASARSRAGHDNEDKSTIYMVMTQS